MNSLSGFVPKGFDFKQGKVIARLAGVAESGMCIAFSAQWAAYCFGDQLGPEPAFQKLKNANAMVLKQIAQNQDGVYGHFSPASFGSSVSDAEAFRLSMNACVEIVSRGQVKIPNKASSARGPSDLKSFIEAETGTSAKYRGVLIGLYPKSGIGHCVGLCAANSTSQSAQYYVCDANFGLLKFGSAKAQDLDAAVKGLWSTYHATEADVFSLA